MKTVCSVPAALVVFSCAALAAPLAADRNAAVRSNDPAVAKAVLRPGPNLDNLLRLEAWRPYGKGFDRQGSALVCRNGRDRNVQRGAQQTVELNQTRPEPIVAACWSRAEDVSGSPDNDYALYLDLLYADGTPLWGQTARFSTGTHDWQRRQVFVLPEKPVKSVTVNVLLRGHAGRASFRDVALNAIHSPAGACLFDGLPVIPQGEAREGFQLHDVAAGTDFVRFPEADALDLPPQPQRALGFDLQTISGVAKGRKYETVTWVTLTERTGKDRAITLVYAVPVEGGPLRWLVNPRRSVPIEAGREYVNATPFHAGSNGRLSRYPLGAVAGDKVGTALAIAPEQPAFCRFGYSADTKELYVACDLALTPEQPKVELCFRRFQFDGRWGFRGALARYYELYPEAFRCRIPQQGLWMPFAKISAVPGWQDFGFRFKEGDGEALWDREHGILTFRYTEPMTWWMRMPREMPRTPAAALAEARRLADKNVAEAKALFTSGYHDADGQFVARLLDTPWCNGAVWSMNSMPGIRGETTDFKNKWNPAIRKRLYGPESESGVDGEYVDSSEGYVTGELDFRREHLAAARTPLVFSPAECRPVIFRGLIAFEYVRGIERDIHRSGKLMMANGAPDRLWWLAPMLDVLGTETDWNPQGKWRPMSDADLLYRRAMCKGKPFCFLMNTRFERFSHERVEKYMKRCLAYGMFPGFFSANASGGHYFTRPELYERDRALFRRYVPLCKRVAEAGWEPITLARSNNEHVYVERFGDRYWTVFNDSFQRQTATIALEDRTPTSGQELVNNQAVEWRNARTTLTLGPEDVVVIEVP